jgi:hypothetical protein
LSLEKNVHLDLAILVSCLGVVDVAFAVEIGDDDNALLVEIVIE